MSLAISNPNVVDLCRLCLNKEDNLLPVFDDNSTRSLLCEKINVCLSIQISPSDRISRSICFLCQQKVDSYYEFRNLSSRSQRMLESLLDSYDLTSSETQSFEEVNVVNDKIDVEGSEKSSMLLDGQSSSREESNNSESPSDEASSSETTDSDDEGENINQNLAPKDLDLSSIPSNSDSVSQLGAIERERSPQDNICKWCQREFITENQLKKHLRKHAGESECELCGKHFSSPAKLAHHSRIHSRKHVCDQCPYFSKSSTNFRIHMMKHNKEYLIECEHCGKGFYQMCYYQEHRAKRHSKRIIINKCHICDKTFHSKFYLKKHTRIHEENYVKKSYQCEACGVTYSSLKGLKAHIDIVHKGNRYKCDNCGKEVTSLTSLKNHMKMHTGEKKFVCDSCGKGFISLSNLVVHKRIHTGAKPFKCESCDKAFNQRSALKVHQRVHSGERPYSCATCSKSFITHTHMKKHAKTHEKTPKPP